MGVSAVNALSEWCEVTVRRDHKIHHQRYEKGIAQGDVKLVGTFKENHSGTETTFRYDRSIFLEDATFKFETLANRFREMAFVTRGVSIQLIDERVGKEMTFHFEGGIASFARYVNRNRVPVHPIIKGEKEIEGVGIEFAVQYTDSYAESAYAFANTINTTDGGTHLTGPSYALRLPEVSTTMPQIRFY